MGDSDAGPSNCRNQRVVQVNSKSRDVGHQTTINKSKGEKSL